MRLRHLNLVSVGDEVGLLGSHGGVNEVLDTKELHVLLLMRRRRLIAFNCILEVANFNMF